jgi:uracil-DNA glycosylase
LTSLATLLDQLATAAVSSDAYNEYAPNDANNALRRANLQLYLETMLARQPDVMLLLEAPGYRGCRITGVPVTSRKILLEGVPELGMFGTAQGYQATHDAGFERVYGEQSASIVWGTLAELQCVPLIRNTYPFHPHQPGKPLTNRAPRKPEIEAGKLFIQQILALYQPTTLIAVGNVAYGALTDLGVACIKVRHPAQGGKNDFVAGIKTAFGQ